MFMLKQLEYRVKFSLEDRKLAKLLEDLYDESIETLR
jgi:hypothetical protein